MANYQVTLNGLTMGTGTVFLIDEIDGALMETVGAGDVPVATEHGVRMGQDVLPARTLTVKGTVRETSPSAASLSLDNLAGAWRAQRIGLSTLFLQMPGWSEYRLLIGRARGIAAPLSRIRYNLAHYTARFVAGDPRWLGYTLKSVAIAAGTTVPCVNAGKFDAIPQWRVRGPVADPRFQSSLGGEIGVVGYSLASGNELRIDPVFKTLRVYVVSSGAFVADVSNKRSPGSSWFHLEPGSQNITLAGTGTGIGYVDFRDSW